MTAEQIRKIPNRAERLQAAMEAAALLMLADPEFFLGDFLDACDV